MLLAGAMAARAQGLLPDELAADYEYLRDLSPGAEADVLLAEHRTTGRLVVIKLYRFRAHADQGAIQESLDRADHDHVVAVLARGEVLDGEGGFCVWGRQTPADVSLDKALLPLGLAHNVRLKRDIPEGGTLCWSDVEYDANDVAVKVRLEMEAAFGRRNVGAQSLA